MPDFQTVEAAAIKWHVPPVILWGVYGVESDFGKNLGPSSAGAVGPFQFLPSTGVHYGLNPSNINSLKPSADAAAHYLSDLHKTTGSWNSALHSYSGGGYGLAEVQKKAQQGDKKKSSGGGIGDLFSGTFPGFPNVDIPKPPNPLDGLKGLIAPAQDIATAVVAVSDFLIHPRRLLKLILGSVMLLWGINQLVKAMGGKGAGHAVKKGLNAAAETAVVAPK